MPATFQLIPSPIGSQFIRTIGNDDPEDLNDFVVYVVASENVGGLTLSDFSFTAVDGGNRDISNRVSLSLLSLEGENSVYMLTIRPPDRTSAVITLVLAANAVSGGNPRTTKTIRVSTSFPDADAEVPRIIFSHGLTRVNGLAVSPTRIFVRGHDTASQTRVFTHTGTERVSERLRITVNRNIDFINGDIVIGSDSVNIGIRRYKVSDGSAVEVPYKSIGPINNISLGSLTHTRLGFTGFSLDGTDGLAAIKTYPYGGIAFSSHIVEGTPRPNIRGPLTHDQDLLYTSGQGNLLLLEITPDDSIKYVASCNIRPTTGLGHATIFGGIGIYRDTLYGVTSREVHTLDIRPYRPMAKNTKTTIYPVFADEGDTIDLKQYAPDAKRIIFDVGYEKPSYLSINNNRLTIASNAVTETTAVLVKCRGINYIDSASFSFYLIIRQAAPPVLKQVDELTMRAGSSYDLNALVEKEAGLKTPPTITFRSGQTQPSGSRLSDGIFTIGNTGGRASFTARNSTGTTHFSINILLLAQNTGNLDTVSETFRHRVEIAGIDVTHDVLVFPRVSARLDVPRLNQYTADNLTLTFRSDSSNDYHYNDGISGNFWETHSLNATGFRERINVFFESFVNGRWVSHLVFAGRILETTENIAGASVRMTCVDLTGDLRGTDIRDFGTLEKWDALRQRSDEVSYAGEYTPEGSLLPMQRRAGEQVWRADGTEITLRELALKSEGIAPASQAYLTPSVLLTAGGFLKDPPFLKFNGQHRAEDVRFLIDQLGLNGASPYNVEVDVPAVSLDTPTLLNRGSVSFSVEDTRVTRLLTDWVYDSTNRRILMLLSNPEGHIEDVLVQYNLDRDNYRLMHVFNRGVKAHRIARRTSTDYYILTSGAITQDRSAAQVPRPTAKTAYAYDSLAQGSNIRIHRFNASTGALTQHVARNNARPPQLGIHAYVGFENDLYVDEFEGIVPHYRGAFKWQGSHLYYRYAKDGEFGVARVNASGTTERLVHETNLGIHNHLNFAFDVTSGGTVYFGYASRLTRGEITVVRNTSYLGRSGSGGTFTHTIINNLSGVVSPQRLFIRATTSRPDLRGNLRIIISGVDADGNAIEDRVARGGGTGAYTGVTEHAYARVNSVVVEQVGTTVRRGLTITTNSGDINELIIKRVASGTITTLFSEAQYLPRFNNRESEDRFTILGITECLFHNNQLYLLASVSELKATGTQETPLLDRQKSAGMALYRCNVTASNPSLTLLETWDFVHFGSCNLHVHEGNVHFMEHPPASQQFKPINEDIDDYEKHYRGSGDDKKYLHSIIPEPLGKLKRINSRGDIEDLGNIRYTDRAFNVAATRPLSIGNDLHIGMAYGDLRSLLRYNSLPSQADNVQHIVRTRSLRYIVPEFEPRGDRYTALAELALKINATLSFSNGLITVRDRSLYRAKTSRRTGTGSGNLSFDGQNKAFPSSGYLRIGDEFIRYTGISGGAFTGVSRGALGTGVADHANDADIFYMNTVLPADRISSDGFSIVTDVSRLHNVITVANGDFDVKDAASIARYGEKPYSLELGLSRHEVEWTEQVFKKYLEDLKDLHQIVRLNLKPTNYLEAGDVVGFVYDALVYTVQVVAITKGQNTTEIQGRTI